MVADKDLKINRIYWVEIIDRELGDLCGSQIKVRFTGIAFRNLAYESTKPIGDFIHDKKEATRKKIIDRNLVLKKDAVLFLGQIKIFKELSEA
ncbi:MAG: hypothetical protein HYS25_01095 [Ignavibacteriales bacterium]|nr:hypothetical protein [Ignavibacteriales bacterium]